MTPEKDIIIAKNREHLQYIVHQYLHSQGPECDLNHIDVSQITDMSHLFNGLDYQGSIDKWNTANVKKMAFMFKESSFNNDISSWNVSNVKNMARMFEYAKFNGSIEKWNTSNVEIMNGMFYGSDFKGCTMQWDTSNVQDMQSMFGSTYFNSDISRWNVSKCVDFRGMFESGNFRGDLSKWNIRSDAQISRLFDKDRAVLFNKPCVYHWMLALEGHQGLLKPEWLTYFYERESIARVLGASNLHAAIMIQNTWLQQMQLPSSSNIFAY